MTNQYPPSEIIKHINRKGEVIIEQFDLVIGGKRVSRKEFAENRYTDDGELLSRAMERYANKPK